MKGPTYQFNYLIAVTLFLFMLTSSSYADKIRIAVASNFAPALKIIANSFETQTGHEILISPASTGKHFAQITQGAPFDIFFAADSNHPQLLEQQGIAVAGSRFTYAQGKLVLWSLDAGLLNGGGSVLDRGNFRHLAIANPKLAPYGIAAKQVLESLGLWNYLRARIVRGENIGHTFQFVYSGNAQLGFIARSQYSQLPSNKQGSFWLVPQSLYTPIEQQAVLLSNRESSREFVAFVKTPQMVEIIQRFGYGRSNDK